MGSPAAVAATDRDRGRPVSAALATEWREVGRLGQVAVAGLALSAVVAVVLGVWIQASMRHHLLDVRTELIASLVDDLASDGLLPLGRSGAPDDDALARAVEHRFIGGEIVDVVIRDATGAVVYGDAATAIVPAARPPLPHVEQHDDGLLHFLVPVHTSEGQPLGMFEVFQEAGSFDEVLARVRRNLWLSIGSGLGVLAVAMGTFTLANARVLDRRRRHAEQLLRELLQVEDEGRRRIVGLLHDGVGQPLYRLMYGLEGCRARIDRDSEVAAELDRLERLVRDVDSTLRTELRHLYRSSPDQLDLASALEAMALECREEFGLRVDVESAIDVDPPPLTRSLLLRAVQEGLVNVTRHAEATAVAIRAEGTSRWIEVEVTDDGIGPAGGPSGLGLTTAAERLRSCGGRLAFGRHPKGGAYLRLSVPVTVEVGDEAVAG